MRTITNKKVRDAVNNIIQNHVFYATMLLQQNIIEDNSEGNPTFYVDGKNLAYNSNFVETLSFDEVKGVIIHEIFHLIMLHHTRMGKRDAKMWNCATDYTINFELIKEGFILPKDLLYDPQYGNMNAEDIYRIIEQKEKDKKKNQKPDDKSGQKGNEPKDSPSFGEVRESKEADIEETAKIQTKQALSIAKAAGELPNQSIIDMIGAITNPKFNWRDIINQFITEIVAKDYSFEHADNRFLQNGIVIPSLYSKAVANIVVAIDTSGSVNLEEVKAIVIEAKNCLDIMSEDKDNATLTVIYCDAMVQSVDVFDGGNISPNPKGGGGTKFSPVFKYIEDNNIECDAVIYITDGFCNDFGPAPDYRVLWGITTRYMNFKPPFGEKFDFDINWM